MSEEITLTARWVFPVGGPPLAEGTVTYAEGRIVAVEPKGRRRAGRDFGNAAILPGFVNAHTHLDLTDAAGKCPPTADFPAWLRQVIAHRRSQSPEDVERAVASGIKQLLGTGTTLVGDITAQGASWDLLVSAPLSAVVYHEVLGLTPEREFETLTAAELWLDSRPPSESCVPGISPHAPYSTSFLLFQHFGMLASLWFERSRRIVPFAVHMAETEAEVELIHHRRGPLADFLKEMGLWDQAVQPGSLIGSFAQAEAFFEFTPKLLAANPPVLIHGNYLADVDYLSQEEGAFAPVVYCPRTHAAFGHRPHPFRKFLARGVPVALGTDSLASNPDLDVLAEARYLARHHPDVPGATVLKMLTQHGAQALGERFSRSCGVLTPGRDATLVVLPLPFGDAVDPHELVFGSETVPEAVLYRGMWRKMPRTQ